MCSEESGGRKPRYFAEKNFRVLSQPCKNVGAGNEKLQLLWITVPLLRWGICQSTSTESVSDSSSTSQHSQKENPWERRKMWEEEETIDKPGMATNYFFHVGFLKIMWKWIEVCSLSALPRLSLRHINGFLSWPCALQGPLTRFVRYLHNFRDAWTPSGVSHEAQRSKDNIKDKWHKPWIKVLDRMLAKNTLLWSLIAES